MDQTKKGGVSEELEKRLDDLFGTEEEEAGGDAVLETASLAQDSPLRNLKGIVLSIDWEITDRTMEEFLEEVEALRGRYREEKIPSMFLRLLAATGKYLRSQKARAHPDAVRVLTRVYTALEEVILAEDMPDSEKRKRLYREVNRFKRLKEEITAGAGKREQAPLRETPPAPPGADRSGMPPHEAFARAVEEIKQVIKAEFRALRAEIRLWREGR